MLKWLASHISHRLALLALAGAAYAAASGNLQSAKQNVVDGVGSIVGPFAVIGRALD